MTTATIDFDQLYKEADVFSLLAELNPTDKREYAALDCPACGEHEAFIYYNKKKHIECNRKANCGEVTSIWDYLKERDSLGSDALIELIKGSNELDNRTEQMRAHEENTDVIRKAPQEQQNRTDYTDFFLQANKNLHKTEYLERRGISKETADKFNIGYVEAWQSPKALADGKNPKPINVIVFPSGNHGYAVRQIDGDYKGKEGHIEPYLWGKYDTDNPIYIVEGYIDALSLAEMGKDAIALGGTAFNTLIKSFKDKDKKRLLILYLDRDDAGIKATEKLSQQLKDIGCHNYIFNDLNEHKDPNEALLANREKFQKALAQAERTDEMLEEDKGLLEAKKQYEKSNLGAGDWLASFLGDMDKVDTPAISTGFKSLDKVLDGGFYEGLYFLGAVSSLGKTTLALQISDHIAQKGQDVLIFSLEMATKQLMARSMSRHSFEITGDRFNAMSTRDFTSKSRVTNYNEKQMDLYNTAMDEYGRYLHKLNIKEGVGNLGVKEIRETIENFLIHPGRKPFVVVDYLQIMSPSNPRATDKQNMDQTVLELKRISRDHSLSILVISSINRNGYKGEITMSSFKESGAIEYTADALLGLQFQGARDMIDEQLDEAYEDNPRKVELKILKNREGEKGGRIKFNYYPQFNFFQESN